MRFSRYILTPMTMNLYTVFVSNWNSDEIYGAAFHRRKEEDVSREGIREYNQKTTQFLSKQSLEEGKRGLELYRPSCHSTPWAGALKMDICLRWVDKTYHRFSVTSGCLLSRKVRWTERISSSWPKIDVFYWPEWTKGGTTWKWISSINKFRNECYKELKRKK